MLQPMEPDESARPEQIGLLGAEAVVGLAKAMRLCSRLNRGVMSHKDES